MQKLLRRIRGAIGIGLTWGVAWSFVGLLPRLILGYKPDAPFPIIFAVFGFFAGIIFSLLLTLTQGRRRFDELSLPRFAAWGGLGGLLFSAIFAKLASLSAADILAVAPAFAAACAVSASGSLALARRSVSRELTSGARDEVAGIDVIRDPAHVSRELS
jgi:O-antigen/teichoic acid export membrane protein